MKKQEQIEKEIPSDTISSEFGITINIGDGNFVKIKSGITILEGASDAEIDRRLDTWERSFWKQYDRVLETTLKVKKRFKDE